MLFDEMESWLALQRLHTTREDKAQWHLQELRLAAQANRQPLRRRALAQLGKTLIVLGAELQRRYDVNPAGDPWTVSVRQTHKPRQPAT